MLIVSALFAGTIAGPIRRLSAAADRVRRGVKARIEIPDFTDRSDEIGHLSGSLRDMTRALYNRIEAIESFAADVAHELKNPLTSLRSAVETLPLARNEDSRARLLAIIQHDVRRLDRLISDISDASRLDAELARTDAEPVDLVRLAETVVAVQNEVKRASPVFIRLAIAPHPMGRDAYIVPGHDLRLGQVITNIVDNACSFSPEGGEVRVFMQREPHAVTMSVEDDGPGIPPHALERIFERFYTDRPEEQGFGQNSGLGLSISRQIVEAHRGTIAAENRLGPTDADGEATRLGARFIVRLPAQG
jgi:two-component system sensor histidine kinase ChvG